jgi:hypothetical protein
MRVTPLLILLAAVIGHAASENIYFNTNAAGCEGPIGCNWNDQEIWIGGRVPTDETDTVYLNDTRPNIHVIYNSSSSNIYINSLFVSGVTLGIQSASLNLNALLVENSTVSIDLNSILVSYEDTTVQHNSTVTLLGGSILSLEEANEFVLDRSSFLYVGPGSKLLLYHSPLPPSPLHSSIYRLLFSFFYFEPNKKQFSCDKWRT